MFTVEFCTAARVQTARGYCASEERSFLLAPSLNV
jgi:hypothetical protein